MSEASAEPDKGQYELQERCGKAAAVAFKNDNPNGAIGNTKDGKSIAAYENHLKIGSFAAGMRAGDHVHASTLLAL